MEEKAEKTWFSDIWFTNNLCPLIALLVPSHLFPSQPSNPLFLLQTLLVKNTTQITTLGKFSGIRNRGRE